MIKVNEELLHKKLEEEPKHIPSSEQEPEHGPNSLNRIIDFNGKGHQDDQEGRANQWVDVAALNDRYNYEKAGKSRGRGVDVAPHFMKETLKGPKGKSRGWNKDFGFGALADEGDGDWR